MTEQPAPGSRRIRRTAVAVFGCAVLAVAGYVWLRPSDDHAADAAPPPSRAAPAPPVPTPATTPRPKPGPPHDSVSAAAPRSFTLTGRKFTIRAHVCPMANIRPYDPPGDQHHTVCWVRSGFGVAPGSHTATTHILGHSWAQDDQEVLNEASALATREILRVKPHLVNRVPVYPVQALDGYRLVLRTRTGILTYEVRNVYGVDKNQLGYIRSWENDRIRNRVVVTTCAELNGVDYDYNVIIEAYLVSSKSR